MVERKQYLEKLWKWKDAQVIKVVTGIRRCGKSTLLQMFQGELKKQEVADDQIISVNFEDIGFSELLDYQNLFKYVTKRLCNGKKTYVFLDEIQIVPEFQKAVDSLFLNANIDLYITGSNAYLLSSELATLLTGRYVEISMFPLSFAEFCKARHKDGDEKSLAEFMNIGGFPFLASLDDPVGMSGDYLDGIYHTILFRDIEERQKRKTTNGLGRKVNDMALLSNIAGFLAGTVGNRISIKRITDYIASTGRRISQNTVNDYVSALVEPFLFYPAERIDLAGKQLLSTNGKYYIADLGLRNRMIDRKKYELGFSLENLVFIELMRRGFKVNVGKTDDAEIDFVACKDGTFDYLQVTASMAEKTTFEREMAPLRAMRDNYSKTVLTLDRFTEGNYGGIIVKNVIDWLLE
ncbi:MAG: ATP-binding protein [Candidatus Cloacimonetes bacterium]|nr:ATP-binding protein [Candidatus Cloacimonadota bacterium]